MHVFSFRLSFSYHTVYCDVYSHSSLLPGFVFQDHPLIANIRVTFPAPPPKKEHFSIIF